MRTVIGAADFQRLAEFVDADEARQTLGDLLTPENIAAEVRFFSDPDRRSIERPYSTPRSQFIQAIAASRTYWATEIPPSSAARCRSR